MTRRSIDPGGIRAMCRNGLHAWTADNIYTSPSGSRSCRECARIRNRRRTRTKEAAARREAREAARTERACAVQGCDLPYSSKGYCKKHGARMARNGTVELVGRTSKSPADRLWSKVDRTGGPDACWPFMGRLSAQGYGTFRLGSTGSRTVGAHCAAYELTFPGSADVEMYDHICHEPTECAGGPTCPHRRCCNPSHLKPSTVAENSSVDRQWTRRFINECHAGHEYTEANTYIFIGKKGRPVRRCRACDSARQREYKARRAAS